MIEPVGSPTRTSRRAALASLLAWSAMRADPWARHVLGAESVEREHLARVERQAGLAPPLTLGMARVVLQPGATTWAATPGGVRMIVVEAGVLGIAAESPDVPSISSAALTPAVPPKQAEDELLIPAGASMAFGARGLASVRNPGARPVVLLDAVVYPAEPRPIARAFTTNDGVSFQLLASANADAAPAGPVLVTLERLRLGPAAALPVELCAGLTLIYVEAGGLDLLTGEGPTYAARAAASAPYAMPGSLQPVPSGEQRGLTAGGVIFLPAGSRAGIVNAGARPAELLALTVREVG